MFFFSVWIFDVFEVSFFVVNKKYKIFFECICGCLYKLVSDELEMKWMEVENRGKEDKLVFDLFEK